MKINLNNRTYRIDLMYQGEDTTIAAALLDTGKNTNLPVMAEAKVVRHHNDKIRSKAKRRVYAIIKLLRKMKLNRTQRTGVWEQLWGQMNVPHN